MGGDHLTLCYIMTKTAGLLGCSEPLLRKCMWKSILAYVKLERDGLPQGADLQRISLQQRFVPSWYGSGP